MKDCRFRSVTVTPYSMSNCLDFNSHTAQDTGKDNLDSCGYLRSSLKSRRSEEERVVTELINKLELENLIQQFSWKLSSQSCSGNYTVKLKDHQMTEVPIDNQRKIGFLNCIGLNQVELKETFRANQLSRTGEKNVLIDKLFRSQVYLHKIKVQPNNYEFHNSKRNVNHDQKLLKCRVSLPRMCISYGTIDTLDQQEEAEPYSDMVKSGAELIKCKMKNMNSLRTNNITDYSHFRLKRRSSLQTSEVKADNFESYKLRMQKKSLQNLSERFKLDVEESDCISIVFSVREVKAESKSLKCTECTKSFVKAGHLVRHMKVVHDSCQKIGATAYWNLDCCVCQKQFATKASLRRHLKVHNNPLINSQTFKKLNHDIYSCTQCYKQYKNYQTLKRHILRDHRGRKEFCSVCEIVVKRLDNHKRFFHGYFEYNKCPHCMKGFKFGIARHIRTVHYGEKRRCLYCDLFLSNVNKHMTSMHSEVVSELQTNRTEQSLVVYKGPHSIRIFNCT